MVQQILRVTSSSCCTYKMSIFQQDLISIRCHVTVTYILCLYKLQVIDTVHRYILGFPLKFEVFFTCFKVKLFYNRCETPLKKKLTQKQKCFYVQIQNFRVFVSKVLVKSHNEIYNKKTDKRESRVPQKNLRSLAFSEIQPKPFHLNYRL